MVTHSSKIYSLTPPDLLESCERPVALSRFIPSCDVFIDGNLERV